MVTHNILEEKKNGKDLWTHQKSTLILLSLCRGFCVCKGPDHQSYSSQSLYICFLCNVTGTTAPRYLSSNTLKTPPYLVNQAHCFIKVKLTNPSHTVLYGWAANFKHQLRAEHATDLSWTVDALSCAGRGHTLNIYGQEIGKDVRMLPFPRTCTNIKCG